MTTGKPMGISLKHGLKGWCHSLGVFAASPPPTLEKVPACTSYNIAFLIVVFEKSQKDICKVQVGP